jgi:hypothetical protein
VWRDDVDRGKPQFCLSGPETGDHTTFPHDMSWRMGRDSSVGITTRYWPGSPGIETLWGAKIFPPVRTGSEANPVSYTMDVGSFTRVKRPERGVDHPLHSRAEVKKGVRVVHQAPAARF